MEETLGRGNPTVKRLRRLRREPALRRAEGVFVAEGLHLVEEALDSGAEIELVVAGDRLDRSEEGRRVLTRLNSQKVSWRRAGDTILESLQDARTPQPILALVRRAVRDPAQVWKRIEGGGSGPLAIAHGLQDPGNLGTVWRTADAAGAVALAVNGSGVDPFHPRAVRATMGSVFRLPVVEESLDRCLTAARRVGARLLGAVPRDGADFRETRMTGPLVVILGSEAGGLPEELRGQLDELVSIRMSPGVESLSVTAAAAVILFEAARQRGS